MRTPSHLSPIERIAGHHWEHLNRQPVKVKATNPAPSILRKVRGQFTKGNYHESVGLLGTGEDAAQFLARIDTTNERYTDADVCKEYESIMEPSAPAAPTSAPGSSTFDVWTLDVWGNAEDGWETNDRSKVGTVEVPNDADDAGMVDALISAGYLQPSARGRVEVEGDDMQTSINAPNGRPLLDVWKRS